MTEEKRIGDLPTKSEHDATVRKIWKIGFMVAGGCFAFMGAIVAVMLAMGKSPQEIVAVELLVVYIVLPAYAFGFMAPMLTISLLKMSLAVDMSRTGLEIGQQTSEAMTEFKEETKPLVADMKAVVHEARPMVLQVQHTVDEVKKVVDGAMKEIKGENGGTIEDKVVKIVRRGIQEARHAVKDAEGDFERLIFNKVDKFLEVVFAERQDEAPEGSREEAPVGDGPIKNA